MYNWWEWVIFGTLLGAGVLAIAWQSITYLARKVVGGETMLDFIRRVTAREFLAFGFVGGYAVLITVGGYEVPRYVSEVLIPAILVFGGFMAITGRNKKTGS